VKRSLLNSLFDSPWKDIPRLCSKAVPTGSSARSSRDAVEEVMKYEPREGRGLAYRRTSQTDTHCGSSKRQRILFLL
jgi:hypothetical protein